jgi:hypothetical protein
MLRKTMFGFAVAMAFSGVAHADGLGVVGNAGSALGIGGAGTSTSGLGLGSSAAADFGSQIGMTSAAAEEAGSTARALGRHGVETGMQAQREMRAEARAASRRAQRTLKRTEVAAEDAVTQAGSTVRANADANANANANADADADAGAVTRGGATAPSGDGMTVDAANTSEARVDGSATANRASGSLGVNTAGETAASATH